jgi:hypothetical protein
MYKKRDGDEKEMTCRQVCRENQVLAFVHSQNRKLLTIYVGVMS